MKLVGRAAGDDHGRITRQRCRVRIETFPALALIGCILASPGSDAGCGLKQGNDRRCGTVWAHHPAAMPGAD